jgi:HlyD family secretion protein
MVLDQPALETQLQRQTRDLRELIQINADLNRQDAQRLKDARAVRDTALGKLQREQRQLEGLQATYAQKAADFAHLARQDVVAPLAKDVVATSDRNTQLKVEVDNLAIERKEVINAFSKVQLASTPSNSRGASVSTICAGRSTSPKPHCGIRVS